MLPFDLHQQSKKGRKPSTNTSGYATNDSSATGSQVPSTSTADPSDAEVSCEGVTTVLEDPDDSLTTAAAPSPITGTQSDVAREEEGESELDYLSVPSSPVELNVNLVAAADLDQWVIGNAPREYVEGNINQV